MKRIKRTLKPRFMVVVHRNCCGHEDGFIIKEYDGVCSKSFAEAKKIMKQDIKEFKESYRNAVVVMDLGGLRATVEMPFTNGSGKLDTFITEWKILKI